MCQNKIFEKMNISLTRKLCQKEIPRVYLIGTFSDDIEALKNHEKLRLSEISKYNVENSIDKMTAKIEKLEEESNDILVQNMINAQDEVDFMDEETTKLLKLQIEERLQQTKSVEEQINNLPTI